MSPDALMLVRPAVAQDAAPAVALMGELAELEGHVSSFTATPERLVEGLFGPAAGLRCWVAVREDVVEGVALCATTWTGIACRPSLRLLNLVVAPAARGVGIGSALMRAVAAACLQLDCTLDWMVRAENVAAQDFYTGLGAARRDGWQPWQLSRDALQQLLSRERST